LLYPLQRAALAHAGAGSVLYKQFEGVQFQSHRYSEKQNEAKTRAALAMVACVDWNIGRLLTRLRELELSKRTIVVFKRQRAERLAME
jgi:arylsulfatase A-like enzyme